MYEQWSSSGVIGLSWKHSSSQKGLKCKTENFTINNPAVRFNVSFIVQNFIAFKTAILSVQLSERN